MYLWPSLARVQARTDSAWMKTSQAMSMIRAASIDTLCPQKQHGAKIDMGVVLLLNATQTQAHQISRDESERAPACTAGIAHASTGCTAGDAHTCARNMP